MLNAREFEAVSSILEALRPLDRDMQERVLLFVVGRIGSDTPPAEGNGSHGERRREDVPPEDKRVHDIRALKDLKSPRSATEMAALVAYYLSDLAPEEERKREIQTADLQRYFKQAQYPLPAAINATLAHATTAGYMEQVSRGKYRLNPVGHNLVVHSLPATPGKSGIPRMPRVKSRVKPAQKSSPAKKRSLAKKAK